MEGPQDLLIGLHSIVEALGNPGRSGHTIVATDDGLKELRKRLNWTQEKWKTVPVKVLPSHEFQQVGERHFREKDLTFSRIPGGVMLFTSPLEELDTQWLLHQLRNNQIQRILCLDQVSDVHNAAAILRTASFYNVQALVTSTKNPLGSNPNFTRMASGALEQVPIVKCSSLIKLVEKLEENEVFCVALSEHAEAEFSIPDATRRVALFLGAEETGLSHALLRVLTKRMALFPQGKMKSLNVSVAAAVAMEKIFGSRRNNP